MTERADSGEVSQHITNISCVVSIRNHPLWFSLESNAAYNQLYGALVCMAWRGAVAYTLISLSLSQPANITSLVQSLKGLSGQGLCAASAQRS